MFSVRLLGPVGAVLLSAAVMCSVFGALNGNMLVGPRLLYAMGEDGLAPRALGRGPPALSHAGRGHPGAGGWSLLLVLGVAVLTASGKLDEKAPTSTC